MLDEVDKVYVRFEQDAEQDPTLFDSTLPLECLDAVESPYGFIEDPV